LRIGIDVRIDRRKFIWLGPALCGFSVQCHAAERTPSIAPIPEPHFPSRLYLFIWRNWELTNADRLASVLQTSVARVLELGQAMGLPRKRTVVADQLKRLYVTVIRQNWHVLPEAQITELLGWDRQRFEFTLKEDDFLTLKLGPKPVCERLSYAPPTDPERERAAAIARIVRESLGSSLDEAGEPLFHFVGQLSEGGELPMRDPQATPTASEIDLSSGWRLSKPEESSIAPAARRFSDYLGNSMNVRLDERGARTIRIQLLPAEARNESFRIRIRESEVEIAGCGEAGVFEAVTWLRDCMEARGGPFLQTAEITRKAVWSPRYLYSYFALYGDPLMQPDIDPFPDGYLEKLALNGINGVWMQAILNTLAPSARFREFGEGSEIRLTNLNRLVNRARRFGIKVYLYLNEPRAMSPTFFRKHRECKGRSENGMYAMCTSAPEVREWIGDSVAHILEQVPGLGGFFTITMSENLTNCFSHTESDRGEPDAGDCPRCSKRKGSEVIAELIQTIRNGMRRSSASAELINWDWGWGDELAADLIPLLPRDTRFLSVSEWDQPVHRGGVDTKVGEYSISVIGPGPRAQRNWALAKRHSISPMAKVQFNATWEISAVPYIPAVHLILHHCENLTHAGVGGLMASWTCGGYPSPNLAAAKAYYLEPRPAQEQVLQSVAVRRYGAVAAPDMIEGWRRFSEAFEQFPYGVAIYTIPTQHGPANLLRFRSTGCPASMILFPQDDMKNWCGEYRPETVLEQFRRMAAGWQNGLAAFRAGQAKTPKNKKRLAETDVAIAETCYNHFQSVANQVEFYIIRDRLTGTADKKPLLARMRVLAENEIDLARQQFRLARHHSVIAYEASNHYYYTPLDLTEKILNCRYILEREIPAYEL
jgi:hypothetical protein